MQLKVSDLDVLIADPSSTMQRMLARRVTAAGVRTVRHVGTIRDAMAEMMADCPHVVIGAFHFDDGTGAELVERMRDDARTSSVAFLCVTSEDDNDALDRIRQAGKGALLRKPIDAPGLATALHSTIANFVHEEPPVFHMEGLKVLVVDDSKFARRYVANILTKLGIAELAFANDGLEATEILAEEAFDLVVTDLNMPKMDGDELVRFVREESNQPTVPILMVTSESDSARLAEVHRHGVTAVCDKPFGMDEVRALISTIL